MTLQAQTGKAISMGVAGIQPELERRKIAEQRRKKAEQEQAEYEANAPVREAQRDYTLEALESQTQKLHAENLKSKTFQAFDRYRQTGNTKFLNMFLDEAKGNPMGSMFKDIARIDPIAQSPEIDRLVKQAGFSDVEGFYSSDVAKGMVIMTNTDGSRSLVDLSEVQAATGYTSYMEDWEMKELERRKLEQGMARNGFKFDQIAQIEKMAEAFMNEDGLTYPEAVERATQIVKGNQSSIEDKAIVEYARQNNVSLMEAMEHLYRVKNQGRTASNEQRFIDNYMSSNPGSTYEEAASAYANRTMTSGEKELDTIEVAKSNLDEMDFFNLDISEMKPGERSQIHKHIATIEDLRGIKLTNEDKRQFRSMRDLIALGGKAGEDLTTEETGIIDNTLNKLKTYMVDEVGGKEATSSYETFRNIFRNALYGSSLTDAEIKAFNAAAGTLGQQLQPVLAQLKTQLTSVKDRLSTIYDTNDPYIAHYYFGGDLDDVDRVIEAIEQRIDVVENQVVETQPLPTINPDQPAAQPTGKRPPIESYFQEQ